MILIIIFLDRPYTEPILNSDGKPLAGSITSLERVNLGGVEQTVLIRGYNTDNPILLFVHGGPGYSNIPFIQTINPDLERYFTIVNWDQRGTGKSLFLNMNNKTISREIIERDLKELTELLKKRFSKEKMFLAGHSWGTVIGLSSVQKYPDDYYAYIGIGQVINSKEGDRVTYEFCLETAEKEGNSSAVKELKKIESMGRGENLSWKEFYVLYKWMNYYNGGYWGRSDIKNLNKLFIDSPEYSLVDLFGKRVGIITSLLILNDELAEVNFKNSELNYSLPVYFFAGRYDYQTPSELVQDYYNTISAPYKEMVWFNNSAHYPMFEEPEVFNRFLTEKIVPLADES